MIPTPFGNPKTNRIFKSWTELEVYLEKLSTSSSKLKMYPIKYADYKLNQFYVGWKIGKTHWWISVRTLRFTFGELKHARL